MLAKGVQALDKEVTSAYTRWQMLCSLWSRRSLLCKLTFVQLGITCHAAEETHTHTHIIQHP